MEGVEKMLDSCLLKPEMLEETAERTDCFESAEFFRELVLLPPSLFPSALPCLEKSEKEGEPVLIRR